MTCKNSCLKGLLYLSNVLFFVSGLTLLVVSSLAVAQTKYFKEFLVYQPSLIVVYQGLSIIHNHHLLIYKWLRIISDYIFWMFYVSYRICWKLGHYKRKSDCTLSGKLAPYFKYKFYMFKFKFITCTSIVILLELVGGIVAFCAYPDAKHFMKSTMEIYKNEEVLSPCLGNYEGPIHFAE